LLRERARLVRIRTTAKNRVRAQLADEGVGAPNHGLWTRVTGPDGNLRSSRVAER